MAAQKGHASIVQLLAAHAATEQAHVAEAMARLQRPSPRKPKDAAADGTCVRGA